MNEKELFENEFNEMEGEVSVPPSPTLKPMGAKTPTPVCFAVPLLCVLPGGGMHCIGPGAPMGLQALKETGETKIPLEKSMNDGFDEEKENSPVLTSMQMDSQEKETLPSGSLGKKLVEEPTG